MNKYDKLIEDALRLKLGGVMRLNVLNRIEQAHADDEEYTEEQFAQWIEYLNMAAGWVDNNEVSAGIYRDIGFLLAAKGDNEGAIRYLEGSIDTHPDSDLRLSLERRIKELRE